MSPPRDSEDKAMQLFGLKSAKASDKEIDPIAKLLIGEQRQDGGWAQFKTRESDAYATGEILVALNETGALRTSDPAYRRGVAYLLKTQAADGSWHVKTRLLSPAQISPPPFDFKLPYGDDYVLSYFGTAWADQALMLVLPRAARPEKIYDAAKFETGLTGEKPQPAWVETALFGTTASLQQFLDNGLSANATTSGGTPLLQVVITDLDKVRLVLSRGADVNTRTADGFSALSVAANFRGTTDVVRLLLDHGAKIERPEKDAKGNENLAVPLPLFLAAGTGEIETARLLLQHGDSPNSKVGRRIPLMYAIDMGDAKMVRFLIESGANIEGEDLQVTALQTVVLANYADVLAVLIEKHFDVNAKDDLVAGRGPEPDWPLQLSPEERRLGRAGMANRYLNEPLALAKGSENSLSVPAPILNLDHDTLRGYLEKQGLSRDAIELVTLGGDTSLGAAHLLMVGFNQQVIREFFHIRGGNDQLPGALARQLELAGAIRYGCRVTSFGQDDSGAWAVMEHAGSHETVRGDYVVSALPFSVARNLFTDARLSEEKQRLIREQKYFPADKIFLQMQKQFWKAKGLSGFANTDLVSERFWELGPESPEERGLLLSYVIGERAEKLDAMDAQSRVPQTLADAESVFPGAREHFEAARVKSWSEDTWQRGGLSRFDPGELHHIPLNARREGRIFFAGEHTSRWNGWMQGAIESAHRVVKEISS